MHPAAYSSHVSSFTESATSTGVTTRSSGNMTLFAPREVPLGGPRAMTVFRTLPHRERTTVGAWCFVDHYGPDDITLADAPGMCVPPHPHTGLQTISWLFEGEIEHRDSVGTHAMVVPGVTSLMTAGRGIQHSEYATTNTRVLHGVQLWAVLPEAARDIAPAFHSIPSQPVHIGPATLRMFLGEAFGVGSQIGLHSDFFGAELTLPAGVTVRIPVRSIHEHAVLLDAGELHVSIDGESQSMEPRELLVFNTGQDWIELTSGDAPVRGLLLGGVPFEEQIVMWWNFIGRSHDDIERYRSHWQRDNVEGHQVGGRFGTIDDATEPLPAPAMPGVRLRAR